MPIKEDFCKGDKKPIGKINYNDGENFHWVWPSQAGEAGNDWDASKAVSYTHLTLPTILLV